MENRMEKWRDRTLWKFLLVGVANTLVGSAVMFGCYNLLGLGYWVSSAANYLCGSVLSYFLNKYVTFRSREKGSAVRFAVNIVLCYLLAYGLARPLVRTLLAGWDGAAGDNAAMLAGLVLFTGLNYLGQRRFVFGVRSSDGRENE
jgi:putative flippase GtrA